MSALQPDTGADMDNSVALLQLASGSAALLVRLTGLASLPAALNRFLR